MGKTPKYQQVVDWVHERILSGELKMDDRLETEAEISTRFDFSRQTIRQALSILEREGVIHRVQGSGSYVSGIPSIPGTSLQGAVTIISSYTDSYIFPRILQAMSRVLQESGYATRIMFTNNQREIEKKILLDLIRTGSRDPIIAEPVTSALPNPNREYYEDLRRVGIPILFFNTFYPASTIPHVSLDDTAAGLMAANHLIEMGHRKIGCIFKSDDGQGIRRYDGYQHALIKAGIPLEERRIVWVDTVGLTDAVKRGSWILDRLGDSTAVVCYNDEVAYRLVQLCQERQIRIPDQLSVTSIDNSRLTELCTVPLTSISHPMEALGEKAAGNLLEMMRKPGFYGTFEFAPTITIRESTAPLAGSRASGKATVSAAQVSQTEQELQENQENERIW